MSAASIPLAEVPPRFRELVRTAQLREQARGTRGDRWAADKYRALVHATPFRTLVGAAWWVTAWRLRRWFS